MDRKTALINQLGEFKKELIRKKIPVRAMLFFGSRAQGKAHKYSDVDLIIVSEKFQRKKFHERPVELYDHWTLDYPVDFLCYTPYEFKKNKNVFSLLKEAVKKGIKI